MAGEEKVSRDSGTVEGAPARDARGRASGRAYGVIESGSPSRVGSRSPEARGSESRQPGSRAPSGRERSAGAPASGRSAGSTFSRDTRSGGRSETARGPRPGGYEGKSRTRESAPGSYDRRPSSGSYAGSGSRAAGVLGAAPRGSGSRRSARPPATGTGPRARGNSPGGVRSSANQISRDRSVRRAAEVGQSWGGVARRAAARLSDPGAPARRGSPQERGPRGRPQEEPAQEPRASASGLASGRPRRSLQEPSAPVSVDRVELDRAVGSQRGGRLEQKLRTASRAFEADRHDEAVRLLRQLAEEAPTAAEARELYGLVLYRLGRWGEAIRELEAFATLTSSMEQHHVRADCHRALRQWSRVEELWEELREASPTAALVTEGRIVAAGALADQSRLRDAITLLSRNFDPPRKPRTFHLRRMYALADLYERAGEVGAARELFRRIAADDPGFFDVTERVRALG